MGLRSLFHRKAVTTASVCPIPVSTAGKDEPLSPELVEDLEAAWAELTEAARGSKVTNFHACTRSGVPWAEDPVAVRALAATLREFPSLSGPGTSQV
jgi:hypothetical protein